MGKIQTEIQLNDRMSSVLRDITKALDSVVDGMDAIQKSGATAFDPSTMDSLRLAVNQAKQEVDRMGDAEDDAGEKAEKSSRKHEKLKSVLSGLGKAAAAGAAAVGAAALKIGKDVVKNYAEFEQLEGGVKKLFGDDTAATVMKNARNAFSTAGLSANQYMDTVTSFSASLISSLGGDTAKAAQYADMAITDMSDNANVFGTDMEAVQATYQSLARGQFQTLDNLKLGYSGTKEEMQRLLKDAEKLSGQKFDISSYADMVEAIHIVQKEMKITGTTADEAERTISGSLNMLKASYQNLLTGLGDPSADVKKLSKDVANSLSLVINNIAPVLGNVVKVLPKVGRTLIKALVGLLPDLIETATGLFNSLAKMIVKLSPQLIPPIIEAVVSIATFIAENLPMILDMGIEIILALCDGLTQALPQLLPVIVSGIVMMCAELVKRIPDLLAAIDALLGAVFTSLGLAVAELAKIAWDWIKSIAKTIGEKAGEVWGKIKELVSKCVSTAVSAVSEFAAAAWNWIVSIAGKIQEGVEKVRSTVKSLVTNAVNAIREGISKMATAGYDLLIGLWNGIKKAKDWVVEKVKGIGSNILGAIRGVFKEHSPSRATAEMGQFLMQGLANGIDADAQTAITAAKAASKDVMYAMNDMNATAKIGAEYTGVTGSAFTSADYAPYKTATSSNQNITINIDMSGAQYSVANGNDVNDIVTQIAEGLRSKLATTAKGVYR